MKQSLAGVMWVTTVLLSALSGCSSRNLIETGRLALLPDQQPQSISKIICIWKPAEGRDMKGLPTRGLAGQILFFEPGSDIPVKLRGKGTVLVYLFDDQGTPEEQKKPIHRFRFSLAAWNLHLQEGSLGPSYYVFIPYTRKVVYQVETAVNVRLIPEKGQAVSSDLVAVTLPGPKNPRLQQPLAEVMTGKQKGQKTAVTTLNDRFFRSEAFAELQRQRKQRSSQRLNNALKMTRQTPLNPDEAVQPAGYQHSARGDAIQTTTVPRSFRLSSSAGHTANNNKASISSGIRHKDVLPRVNMNQRQRNHPLESTAETTATGVESPHPSAGNASANALPSSAPSAAQLLEE